ncbi:MAG: hypothetical protein Q7S31_02140 [bacterium]|nr:hypothetical protein [bacterium]
MTLPQLSPKAKLISGLAVLSALAVIYLFVSAQPKSLAPAWKGIQVGRDSKDQVVSKLGSPLAATASADGLDRLDFPSSNQYWPHEVFFKSNTSQLIRERLLKTTPGELQTYLTRYGQPEAVLNNTLTGLEFYLHVWPASGIAVNANPTAGVVFEVWYFSPTTLAKFQQAFKAEIGFYPTGEERF